MKAKRFLFVVVLAMVATLCLTGSTAADPPKSDFYFRWGRFLAGHMCEEMRLTGAAAHCLGQWFKVEIYSTTNPLVSGTFEFWYDSNLGWPDGQGWYYRNRFQGGWRIQPDGIDGYWEGSLSSVGTKQGWYEPISRMDGKGYGALSGYLIKGTTWWEPDPTGESPYGAWPVNGGVIIAAGKGGQD